MKRKERISAGTIVGGVIHAGVILLFAYITYYLMIPSLKFSDGEILFYIALVDIFSAIFMGISSYISEEEENSAQAFVCKINLVVLFCIIIIGIVGWFTSGKMFHAERYQQIVEIRQGNFEEDFEDISVLNNTEAIVDLGTARKLGDRTIGSIEHASWYEVDSEYNLIVYRGIPYRVSSLVYGGLFKYAKADSIPGYVIVNANTQEAAYVEVEGGMKYSPSAYFSYDLLRHLRKQYPSYSFGKSFFEIDDFGNPYWITPVKETTFGMFGGRVETKFIITDSRDGSSKEYSNADLPDWVEHSYSLEYLMDVLHWHYEYVNGYWNFSETGVYRMTYNYKNESEHFYGYNSFVDKNGQVCYYTGLTPASGAESNVGFLAINTKTGTVTQYDVAGAEESSAQVAAEGLVQNLGYEATFPTVINVGGEETYLMALKDKAGLIQRYALVNIRNYTIAVQAEKIDQVISDYLSKLGKTEEGVTADLTEAQEKSGTISKVYSAEIDGTTYFYYVFIGDSSIYKASIKTNEKQIIFAEGDKISIKFLDSGEIKEIVSIQ